jgi:hypothetical protein
MTETILQKGNAANWIMVTIDSLQFQHIAPCHMCMHDATHELTNNYHTPLIKQQSAPFFYCDACLKQTIETFEKQGFVSGKPN